MGDRQVDRRPDLLAGLLEIGDRQRQADRIGAHRILARQLELEGQRPGAAGRSYGERIARNTPIQGSAADILKIAMVEVERLLADQPWARMLLTVHDELIFECDADKVEALIGLVRPAMENAAQLDVPLLVESGHGRTWNDAKG
ncbi:MAG TPA: DNA polymerase [Enhygromyxa sp.]|nr:DNA polymerase [Enhygromyxa sp.]